MKQMTCSAMGGPCEATITGNTPDEMIANGTTHVNEAHPELAESMKTMPKEALDKWNTDFQAKWEATPETEATPAA